MKAYQYAGIAGLAIGLVSVSSAATIITDITPVVVSTGVPVSVNVNPSVDSTNEITFLVIDFGFLATLNAEGASLSSSIVVDNPPPDDNNVVLLSTGVEVGSTFSYGGSPGKNPRLAFDQAGSPGGDWGGGQVGYLGVRFTLSGSTHYGFARVTWNPDFVGTGSTAVIDRVGFNDVAGEPALISEVPEPSVSLLTILAGLAVSIRRRR
jgi:hypothetical protein